MRGSSPPAGIKADWSKWLRCKILNLEVRGSNPLSVTGGCSLMVRILDCEPRDGGSIPLGHLDLEILSMGYVYLIPILLQ